MKDDYYERNTRRVVESIIEEMRQREGITHEKICQSIRAAYPFGDKRGKPYKIWIRIVVPREKLLEAEMSGS